MLLMHLKNFDQTQVRKTKPGRDNLGNLGVDALPDLDAAVGNVDGRIMLIDGDLVQEGWQQKC